MLLLITLSLLPFLIILQFPIRQQLIPHSSQYVGRRLRRYDHRFNDGRRNLTQYAAYGTGDAFVLVFLNGGGVDVSSCVT